jgi:hypothetical protein
MNGIKDIKQRKFADKYIDIFKGSYLVGFPCRKTIISATGTGKSRITFLILDEIHKYFDKVAILVNADRLRDFTWKEEFKKWDRQDILAKTELVNYQTAYKWTQDKVDLSKTFLVLDEIDYIVGTDNYSRIFASYPNVSMLGLTGYCSINKREELNRVCPPIVEYTFEQAVADGVINDVKFVFVKFDLDKSKTIEVKYKDKITKQPKSFMQSENDAYDYADTAFIAAVIKYEEAEADFVLGMCSAEELKKLEKEKERKMYTRLQLLYYGIAAKTVTKKLQEAILKQNPINKVITFSIRTDRCDSLNKYTCHSKNLNEVNDKNLELFNLGEIRSLGLCAKIDRGENLIGLNNCILESFNSSDAIIVQRRGRNARLNVKEVATFYILLPYYMKKVKVKEKIVLDGVETDEEVEVTKFICKPTQAVTWANNMLAEENTENCKIIDLRTIKE